MTTRRISYWAGLVSLLLAAAPLAASPTATPVKRGARACHKDADTHHLSGAARAQFLRQCHAAKRPTPH